jgi:hypothetical protein
MERSDGYKRGGRYGTNAAHVWSSQASEARELHRTLPRGGDLHCGHSVVSLVEVGNVKRVLDGWDEGSWGCLPVDRGPVHAGKEGVALDVAHTVGGGAVALVKVELEQLGDEVAQCFGEVARILDVGLEDLRVHLQAVALGHLEGCEAARHLIHQHTKGPVVHPLVVALALDDLRRSVLGRAAHGVSLVLHKLGKSKVGQLEVAARIEDEVLRLEIAVDDRLLVQILESKQHLGTIEACATLGEMVLLAQMSKQLTASNKLQSNSAKLARV